MKKAKDIMNILNDISYGWLDKNGNTHNVVDSTYSNNYVLESPEQVLKYRVGVCWDQVELERSLFEKDNISFNTYLIIHYYENCPTHTFLIYKDGDKYYWFEHSWEIFRGIHEYNSEEEAINDVKCKFIDKELKNIYEPMNLCVYKYQKPKYGLNPKEFINHCEKGINIK